MDQQLKHRLIGVAIVVALVVIFVPMLFEKSDDKGKFSSTGIPSIPDDILEKTIELPKTAEDIAPKEDGTKPVESGYKIVPLNNEDPSPKPKSTGVAAGQPKANEEGEEDKPVAPEEEDGPAQAKSGIKVEKEIQPTETVKSAPVKEPAAENPAQKSIKWFKAKQAKANKKPRPTLPRPPQPAAEPDTDEDPQEGQIPPPVRARIRRER